MYVRSNSVVRQWTSSNWKINLEFNPLYRKDRFLNILLHKFPCNLFVQSQFDYACIVWYSDEQKIYIPVLYHPCHAVLTLYSVLILKSTHFICLVALIFCIVLDILFMAKWNLLVFLTTMSFLHQVTLKVNLIWKLYKPEQIWCFFRLWNIEDFHIKPPPTSSASHHR